MGMKSRWTAANIGTRTQKSEAGYDPLSDRGYRRDTKYGAAVVRGCRHTQQRQNRVRLKIRFKIEFAFGWTELERGIGCMPRVEILKVQQHYPKILHLNRRGKKSPCGKTDKFLLANKKTLKKSASQITKTKCHRFITMSPMLRC